MSLSTRPLHDGRRLNQNQGLVPVWPEATKRDPDEPIMVLEARFLGLALEHRELMAKRDVFKCELSLIPER